MPGLPNPPGWWTLPVEVVTNGTQLLLVGTPPDEEADPDSVAAHHCDTMGCRWEHVLARLVMDADVRLGLWHLIRAEMDREKATIAASAKPLSLREQIIARKGLVKPVTTLEEIADMIDA